MPMVREIRLGGLPFLRLVRASGGNSLKIPLILCSLLFLLACKAEKNGGDTPETTNVSEDDAETSPPEEETTPSEEPGSLGILNPEALYKPSDLDTYVRDQLINDFRVANPDMFNNPFFRKTPGIHLLTSADCPLELLKDAKIEVSDTSEIQIRHTGEVRCQRPPAGSLQLESDNALKLEFYLSVKCLQPNLASLAGKAVIDGVPAAANGEGMEYTLANSDPFEGLEVDFISKGLTTLCQAAEQEIFLQFRLRRESDVKFIQPGDFLSNQIIVHEEYVGEVKGTSEGPCQILRPTDQPLTMRNCQRTVIGKRDYRKEIVEGELRDENNSLKTLGYEIVTVKDSQFTADHQWFESGEATFERQDWTGSVSFTGKEVPKFSATSDAESIADENLIFIE